MDLGGTKIACAPVKQRVCMFPTDGVRIERSLLEDQAGLLGGIALAAQRTAGLTLEARQASGSR